MTTILSLLFFIVSVALIVYLRTKSNGKYEIKLTDVIIGMLPIILWLLVSGQILELGLGDLKVKLKEAYKKPVAEQITSLVEGRDLIVIGVDCDSKQDKNITSDTTFPSFRPFRYILMLENCEDDKNGNSNSIFWGIVSVEEYKDIIISPGSKSPGGDAFVAWVKAKNRKEMESHFSTFVSIENASNSNETKLSALEKMEKVKTDFLPVINDKKEFLGIIDRARVNSSFLIDIGKALSKE